MALTESSIKKALPRDKQYKLSDGAGLYLLVHTNGSKYWRMAYRFEGKQKTASFGVYPEVSLTEARDKCQVARRTVREGVDPTVGKVKSSDTFEAVARELYAVKMPTWTAAYAKQWLGNLENYALPAMGHSRIDAEVPMTVLGIVRNLEARGNYETRDRLLQSISAVFKYAIATGRAKYNPAEIRTALADRPKAKHMACIEPAELPAFMKAVNSYKTASSVAMTALKLLMLTATRTSEVRYAKWADIDFETACWTIPAEQQGRKGKNGKRSEHKVPLSTQAVELLAKLPRTSEYVFPNRDDNTKVISENTILGIIDAIGYKGKMTGHGFRSLARSILGDMGHRWEVLEAMLSHSLGNSTERAYVRTTYFEERRVIGQQYSDYLTEISE